MAIKRTSSNSISNAVKLSTGFASAAIPNSPTIGAATATSDVAATVAYTAAVLGATGSTFTATSNPSSITGTGASPITVTGLTASTAYTFTVTAGNANGTSAASSASNSITTSAPSGSYQSIATYTVGSGGQSSVTFSSIPQTFTHLQIRGICTTTRNSNDGNVAKLRFNNDTGSNYYTTHGMGSSGLALSTRASGQYTSIYLERTANTNNSNVFSGVILDILDYSLTTKNKAIRALMGYEINATSNTYNLNYQSGLWMSTSAITQIDLFPDSGNFAQYTEFALYGIKGA